MASGDAAFVICQIGSPGSQTRARTDELCDFVLKPPLEERGLRLARADEDPTPGTVSVQIIQAIVNAKVVVADLTGRNANVYYELGVAHSFAKPLLILVDSTDSLAFDLQGERAIVIGDDGAEIGARKAAAAADEVRRQLDVVLAPGYVPQSLVRGAGVTSSLERFATDDPVKAQLVRIADQLEELRRGSAVAQDVSGHVRRPSVDFPQRNALLRLGEFVGADVHPDEAWRLLQEIPGMERDVVIRFLGLDGRQRGTLTDIANEMEIAPASVRRLIADAIQMIKQGAAERRSTSVPISEAQPPQDPSSG